jgi:hypothetical protein
MGGGGNTMGKIHLKGKLIEPKGTNNTEGFDEFKSNELLASES